MDKQVGLDRLSWDGGHFLDPGLGTSDFEVGILPEAIKLALLT